MLQKVIIRKSGLKLFTLFVYGLKHFHKVSWRSDDSGGLTVADNARDEDEMIIVCF